MSALLAGTPLTCLATVDPDRHNAYIEIMEVIQTRFVGEKWNDENQCLTILLIGK